MASAIESKVTLKIGRAQDHLETISCEMGYSVSDAATLLGGIVFHEVIVVERGGIWYLFDDRSFKAGTDRVPLKDNDVVFHLAQNTTYEQLALQHIRYLAGVDAVNALKDKEVHDGSARPKPLSAPAAARAPAEDADTPRVTLGPPPGAGDSIRIDSCQWGTGRMAAARFARIQPDEDGLNVELTHRSFLSINGTALSTDDCQPGFRFHLNRGDSAALGFGEAQIRLVSFTAAGQPAFGCEELDPYATGPFGEVGTRIFSAARIERGRLLDVPEAAAWDGLTVALGPQKRLSPSEERRAKSAANGAAGIPEAVVSPNGSLPGSRQWRTALFLMMAVCLGWLIRRRAREEQVSSSALRQSPR